MPEPAQGTRPGGRASRVRDAVLGAALEELASRPYASITIDTIAYEAGVHRATLYRRWGSVEGILAAAIAQAAQDRIPVPDEGSLESDLLTLARALARTVSDPLGLAVMRVLAVGTREPNTLHTLRDQFWSSRVGGMSVIVHRAVERSELPPHTDPRAFLGAVAAPICYQALVIGRDPDEGDVVLATRAAIAAARAGLFSAALTA